MEEDRVYRSGIPRNDSNGKPCINSAADPYGKMNPFFSECAKKDYYTNLHRLDCLKRCKEESIKHNRACFDKKTGCNKMKAFLSVVCQGNAKIKADSMKSCGNCPKMIKIM